MNDYLPLFLNFFKKTWNSIPQPLRALGGIILFIILIYEIPNTFLRIIFIIFLLIYFVFDVAIPYFKGKVKKTIDKKKEEKRIEDLITKTTIETTDSKHYRKYFPYKLKVKDSSPSQKRPFIDTVKKTLVIKRKIKDNKSENLTDFLIFAINFGYLPQLFEFFTPRLSELIVYEKIRECLDKSRDMEATKLFVTNYKISGSNFKEKDRETYYLLKLENSFDEIFIPLLFYYRIKNKPINERLKKEIEDFFFWLGKIDKRLEKISPTKYLPKISYVYFKKPFTPFTAHEDRIIKNFEDLKCDLCVFGAFETFFAGQEEVSNKLAKSYPLIKTFKGISINREGREKVAKYIIHKNKNFDF